MFEAYDNKRFGEYIKNIRLSLGLSQEKVAKTTKLSTETLRKIENGYVIPRYDTIEYLSRAYKTDLLSALQVFRYSETLFKFYLHIDKVIIEYDYNLISQLDEMIAEIINNNYVDQLIVIEDLDQIKAMINGIKQFYSKNYTKALIHFTKALEISNDKFNTDTFMEKNYSIFESRILLMISMCYAIQEKLDLANKILSFILSFVEDVETDSIEANQLILKIYFNLAYNHHTLNNLRLVIEYSNIGINLCTKNYSTYLLHSFYYRRGIAKYMLNNDDYLDDLEVSITLLRINNKQELIDIYKSVTKQLYDISL